ncbi:hypothetical protein LTR93_011823 [Exophiala xenobiotica]|nr:hypothetical protein LTR93_011823 [Exophiala xenobiotica]
MTRIAIRRMLRAKKLGTILHVASIAAESVSLFTPLYHASKHRIGSLVMGLGALDEFCGIRVVGVAPGSIKTPLMLEDPRVAAWIDLKRDKVLDPTVIADALIALAENIDNRYPAGTLLEVADERQENWRIVPLYNNPGPSVTNLTSNIDEARSTIRQILKKEAV